MAHGTDSDVESKAVAVTLLKGGVTKTSVCLNTAQADADRGRDVAVVDLDTNGNATHYLGYEDHYTDASLTLGDVLLSNEDGTPDDLVIETGLGFDLFPASTSLESLASNLSNEPIPSEVLLENLVEPLLGDRYDRIYIDTPADRGLLLNNAAVASLNLLLPVTPEEGVVNGLRNTINRVVKPLSKRRDLTLLGIVPNKLSTRIDQQTADRRLLEPLCRSDYMSQYLPEFAYIAPETWDAIDDGELAKLPKPAIRSTPNIGKAFGANETLRHYAPDDDQLQYFDHLVDIVDNGGVLR